MWPFRPKNTIPTFPVANTIGSGSRVRGDLSGPAGFRIDGAVEGGVDADGPVVVGEGGSVEGGIRGRDVIVLGRVRGDVHATGHLEIGPKGKVIGDITVESFRMHKGGVFRGTSCMGSDEEGRPALGVGGTETRVRRGRTLPPPNGAVPPPPMLGEHPGLQPGMPEEAVSQERLIMSGEPDGEVAATGTTDD